MHYIILILIISFYQIFAEEQSYALESATQKALEIYPGRVLSAEEQPTLDEEEVVYKIKILKQGRVKILYLNKKGNVIKE